MNVFCGSTRVTRAIRRCYAGTDVLYVDLWENRASLAAVEVGATYAELAKALGISSQAVRQLVQRAS